MARRNQLQWFAWGGKQHKNDTSITSWVASSHVSLEISWVSKIWTCWMSTWCTCWGPTCPPSPIQHHDLPSKLNLFIFVTSLKITCSQSSMVQFSYLWANHRRARTCLWLRNDLLCCICPPNPPSLKARLTLMSLVLDQSCFVVANAIPSQPLVTRVTQRLFSWSARSFEHPLFCLSI